MRMRKDMTPESLSGEIEISANENSNALVATIELLVSWSDLVCSEQGRSLDSLSSRIGNRFAGDEYAVPGSSPRIRGQCSRLAGWLVCPWPSPAKRSSPF